MTPLRALDADDEEHTAPTLDVLCDTATNARGRAAQYRAAAALYLHAATIAVEAADALEMDSQVHDAGDAIAAGTVATATLRKAGAP